MYVYGKKRPLKNQTKVQPNLINNINLKMKKYYLTLILIAFTFSLAVAQKSKKSKYFIEVEAEKFYKQSKSELRKWYIINSLESPKVGRDDDGSHFETASGKSYIEILPDTRVSHSDKMIVGENFSNVPGEVAVVHYKVKIKKPGRYYVWVKAHSTGSEDNGLHVGIDGTWPEHGQRMQWCDGKDTWTWGSSQRTAEVHCGVAKEIYLDIEKSGVHDIQFSMREDEFEFVSFILTTDIEFIPKN